MKRLAMLLVFAVAGGGLWWMNREAPPSGGGQLSPEGGSGSAAPTGEELRSGAADSADATPSKQASNAGGTPDAASLATDDPEVGVTVMPPAIGTGMQALRSQPEQPTLEQAQSDFLERVQGWADDLSAEADIAEEYHPVLVELLVTWSNERALAGQNSDRQEDLERQARSKFELSVVRELGQDAWDRIEEAIEDEPPWLLDGR
ncbi:MAG: hypothetical protein ACYS26_01330 [Planctomycetota bacterium]|jgi:hypothetical protein